MIHFFERDITDIPLPKRFTCPFHYTPHRLCIMAAESVQKYLQSRTDWYEELCNGKMFGVLIVESSDGRIGFLTAFSGLLDGKNDHPFFVPPVFDMLQPTEYFKQEESLISSINHQIAILENDKTYLDAHSRLKEETDRVEKLLRQEKQKLKQARDQREMLRQTQSFEGEQLAAMTKESQFQKAELKRLERSMNLYILELQADVRKFTDQIDRLKKERKKRSIALQTWLFSQFRMLNARGETKNLCEIFSKTKQLLPPAGAGECAAPKLLQYAYVNGMKPLAMAEFWWGGSPKSEIRRQGNYYPACKGKCEPILEHMLHGLEVEENPLNNANQLKQLEVVFEDEYLVIINKPAGMLSVPGKDQNGVSVYSLVQQRYPDATGPLAVHRLDMATSGLLLFAKNKEVHENLQSQFADRTVKKCYIALLEGASKEKEGRISLPLSPDILDRPRQKVDDMDGKPAFTRYKTLSLEKRKVNGIEQICSRVAFYPETGRTHQLRVHSAHPKGLGIPILGDALYGHPADRLYLHARQLEFVHPITKSALIICQEPDF